MSAYALGLFPAVETRNPLNEERRRPAPSRSELEVKVHKGVVDPVRLIQSLSSGKHSEIEATQFELHVRWNGRSYMATRSFYQLQELQRELSSAPELPGFDGLAPICGKRSDLRGFSLLQALLQAYEPLLEEWFREVVDRHPPSTSPVLARFFWEPLGVRDVASHSSLNRIEESASEESEDD